MRIAEIFRSLQGEGMLTGTPSVFIRTSGCNLRCTFCDTPYASWEPEGADLSIDEILAQVEEWDTEHVILTGGEPMLFAELIPLAEQLKERGKHITIETAGTLYLPVLCDLMSISPKLSNSTPSLKKHPRWSRRHESQRHAPEVMHQLMDQYDYQLKFVVDRVEDLSEIEQYLTEFPEAKPEHVLLMPQGVEPEELNQRTAWLESYCQEQGYPFCPRKHIEWFGKVRGT